MRVAALSFLALPASTLAGVISSRQTVSGPSVTVKNGTLLGRSEPLGSESYLGIPFAAPPVGNLVRFF